MAKYQSFQTMIDNQMMIPKQLLTDYQKLGMGERELLLLLQLHRFRADGNLFPTPEELAQYLSVSSQECSRILRSLIQKQLLQIEQQQNDQHVLTECYSLEPLWDKLFSYTPRRREEAQEFNENIFPLFEQEFGRPLSPFEIENINIWLDEEQQSPALIKAALREAVLMSKLNFKYIDRILREWKRKGVHTVEQAREQGKQFRQGGNNSSRNKEEENTQKKRDVSLYYNWLEEDS
ncbi:DnaD domain-containing protein [Halobacillus halophilus]|uniref:DnaD domain-containing protein n=1 Tax=Halobacillus halophilus TaxID=1570 RepID=UPI001CD6C621|nr:DnaD domain-containing protein [Halobacillus halophilus]MCA1009434.1 DnaD domain-containing protein [Halobacillus halophilus]